jgi:DNA primase
MLDCRALFKSLWPEHYRENGNCLCPFHDDRDPSMQVTSEAAYCHAGCGNKDAIDLYRKAHGVGLQEALRELGTSAGLEEQLPVVSAQERLIPPVAMTPNSPNIWDY